MAQQNPSLPSRQVIAPPRPPSEQAPSSTLGALPGPVPGLLRTPGDIYVAAVRADHLARCTRCREVHAAVEAAAAENAESMARRDRRQLGLNIGGRRLVAAGIIRRVSGRTLTVRATEAGVTGSIRPAVTR
ncbi:hypothetical protein ACFW88_00255 [Streptomyces anandii]|uniref:Uncharacterized protein n=1 Tax=Streptomyces anandii TaxID=285454 RepID=A0ABW6GXG3_9ACTN